MSALPCFAPYLAASDMIDFEHPLVAAKAAELAAGQPSDARIARAIFHFVRDAIHHSVDYQRNPVTRAASEVLAHGTGYCYAKSHLLTALLRANGIPAGLCYQRLIHTTERYCLHGLVAVHLKEHGWYRIDPRGNKNCIDAQFTPPVERLAFIPEAPGEVDFPEIHAAPLPEVVAALHRHDTWDALLPNLPDLPV
jgi:transglutaminase-like putative cysteine protease